jgi:sirohydrochlorin cobaltochelatase
MADALLIAAHGSRDDAGVEEFWALAEAWQSLRPDRLQSAGFLEFVRPTIAESISELVDRGATRVTVVPAMLMAAGHVKNDVPSELAEARARHPGIAFHMARGLDIHASLLELCQIRFGEALHGRPNVPREQTVLLLVGRGTSDPDANSNIARVSRFLWESLGVAWSTVAFSGLASPTVDEALTLCRRMGFSRIVVQPYFLFDGVLLKRVHETASWHASVSSDVEIVTTEHFRAHPLLLKALEDRAFEAIHGSPVMNCDVCKYRTRLTGREEDWGAPQVGHHHHVRATRDLDDHDHSVRQRHRFPTSAEDGGATFHPWDEQLLRRLELVR